MISLPLIEMLIHLVLLAIVLLPITEADAAKSFQMSVIIPWRH